MKTIVIAAYVGPLPALMPLWLRSAGHNRAIDFLVVSDQPAPPNLPANVRFLKADLANLRTRWSALVGFEVALTTPYKLNDFKPLYWALCDDLERYDYWGYCDLDVLFGDLSLVTEGRLGRYDMILSEGHLRLLRNDARTREAWRDIAAPRRWQEVLADPHNFGMDEHHGINRVFAGPGRSWFADPSLVADVDPGFRQLRLLPQFSNHRRQGFCWMDGRVLRESWIGGRMVKEEFAYIHLQKRKLTIDPEALNAPAFDIDQTGIFPRNPDSATPAARARRNPWHWPGLGEARIALRELRRRAARRSLPFAMVDWVDLA